MSATALIWILVDIFLYFKYGNAATESASTWRDAYVLAGIPFAVGTLCGHLFGQKRAPSTVTVATSNAWQAARGVMLILLAAWMGFDIYSLIHSNAPSFIDNFVWAITYHKVWVVFFAGFCNGALFYQMDDPTVLP